jgi:import inner membrane translocase subunit TIM13
MSDLSTDQSQQPQPQPSSLSARLATDLVSILARGTEETCFARCIPKPGLRMDAKEERCVRQCMERFVEAWTVTMQTVSRVSSKQQQEQY